MVPLPLSSPAQLSYTTKSKCIYVGLDWPLPSQKGLSWPLHKWRGVHPARSRAWDLWGQELMQHLHKNIRDISKQRHLCHWVLGIKNVAVLHSTPWKNNSQCEGSTAPLQRRWNSEYKNYRINLVKKVLLSKQVQLNQTIQDLSQMGISPWTETFANAPSQHRTFIFWENSSASPAGMHGWAWLRLPSSSVCEKIHCLDKILGEGFSILH